MQRINAYPFARMADANEGSESSGASDSESHGSQGDEKQKESDESSQSEKEPSLQETIQGIVEKHAESSESDEKKGQDEGKEKEKVVEEGKEKELDEKKVEGEKEQPKTEETKEDKRLDKNPRFQEVIRERNEIKAKYEQAEPIVQRMQNIEGFCQKNYISPEDFDESLKLTALLKTNPQEGIRKLESKLEEFRIAAGVALPKDLQKLVDDGKMDATDAGREARLRLEKSQLEGRLKQTESSAQENQKRELNGVFESWTKSKMSLDPDFKPKKSETEPDGKFELFTAKLGWYWQNVPMYTVQDFVKHAEKAYMDVNGFVKKVTPAPVAKRSPMKVNGSRNGGEKDKPLDITKPGWAREIGRQVAAEHESD